MHANALTAFFVLRGRENFLEANHNPEITANVEIPCKEGKT